MGKKLFILAGEASGDLHAAGAVAELRRQAPDLDIFGVGGGHLKALNVRLLYEADQISFMGFVEVAKHYLFLRKVFNDIKAAILQEKPDAALLIDYPGMNLILAEFLHVQGIPVIYYIAPQVWAWKEGRVEKIRKFVSRLLVVFDFEVEFFKRHNVKAEFVGHPIIEELSAASLPTKPEFLKAKGLSDAQPIIGLLPGSRKQELERIFPGMLRAAELLQKKHGAKFLLGRAPTIPDDFYRKFLKDTAITPIDAKAYEVMSYSDLLFVTSGTATLESLCFGAPMIVLYRTNGLNYLIGRQLVKIKNIALANIVSKGLYSDIKTVPELLQNEMTAERIASEADRILSDKAHSAKIRRELLAAKEKLGQIHPSEEVARIILETISP
ncbi:MAG: lipid-A-disaccharide synthase [Chlorobiales bacterium]|nr:lipid-A-disaccharide synthase [Chlorobiales bacterium]